MSEIGIRDVEIPCYICSGTGMAYYPDGYSKCRVCNGTGQGDIPPEHFLG